MTLKFHQKRKAEQRVLDVQVNSLQILSFVSQNQSAGQ